MARPTKYNADIERRFLQVLESGVSRKTAAEYVGIDEGTVINWMKRYSGFSSAVIQTEAKTEVSAVLSLRQAWANGDWRAGLEYLKRRRSRDWSETHRIEIISSVREMARAAGADEEAAVAEAESFLREMRGARAYG